MVKVNHKFVLIKTIQHNFVTIEFEDNELEDDNALMKVSFHRF